ncbi:tetratricopeptide repeat protein [Aquimarina algiphila]|uniref:tetratricopeptide repeat protein n=1 Tax=Aquimarina algiphila TaxID=2047982 RepID=UPI00232BE031|nr:tetratricopeptide repeat protein [Aquimarina algiphila]
MKRTRLTTIVFFASFFTVFPCFWDYDTIEMERQKFPSVIELISGKFLRHSPEFHYWRIKDREEKLQKFPDSLPLLDDLAVSYSKIGADKKAIKIILKKEAIKPGEYKTYANLGTFYLHDGQFKKGIEYIDKAVEINPEAHFGREIYQRHVAEYVLSKMKNGKIPLPLSSKFRRCLDCLPEPEHEQNFYAFLVNKYEEKKNTSTSKSQKDEVENGIFGPIRNLPYAELEKAIIGIMGMMKFGNYDSPVLLEVLGDLLMGTGRKGGARQLAARAYFKASYNIEDDIVKEVYKKKIVFTLFHQYTKRRGKKFTLYELEELLIEEINEGNRFYQKIRDDEMRWIRSGMDPEQEFTTKYYKEPKLGVRIQHGKGGQMHLDRKYARDTTIGKIIDYRPVPKQNILLDSTYKKDIDSLFDKKPDKEENITQKTDSEGQKENEKTIEYWVFVVLTIGVLGIGIWVLGRRKK